VAFAAILASVGANGCASANLPPVKTYDQAAKEVTAKGPLVSAPIEEREGFKEGTSKVVKKDETVPSNGILIDKDKAAYYVAIKAERDRRRKELEAARKNLEVQKIIHVSALDHIAAKVKANNTWWERNKGLMGLAFGAVLGIGLTVGILYAVTKGQGTSTSSTNTHVLRW
jgi:hypothetical protein